MSKRLKISLMALAGVLAAGAAFASAGAPGHSHATFSAGEPGNPKRPSRTIEVVLTEEYGLSTYMPQRIEVKRGEQIKFVLRNTGKFNHEFILASTKENLKHAEDMKKHPEMEHDDPNAVTLKPGEKSELLWRFTKRGTFEYACLVPGHREEGMIGVVVVK